MRLEINNIKGTVTVIGWDRNEVQVSGQLGDGAQPLTIEGNNSALTIKVRPQGKSSGWLNWGSTNNMAPSTLTLRVPQAASLEVNVVSAPLQIDGVEGGNIRINSVSGKVRINARTPSLEVDSVSGSIEVAGYAGHATLQTVSGDILVPVLGETGTLETISGRIQAGGGPWQTLTISSVSGDVQASGAMALNGVLAIDSMSGDVQLQLPGATSGSLHASTFSGDLRSDFGTPRESEHGPGSKLDAKLG
ncbi:MAG: DUF4097 family beta strand repeat-containing protein, partial [Rhodanobacter sp.]